MPIAQVRLNHEEIRIALIGCAAARLGAKKYDPGAARSCFKQSLCSTVY
jgi:hypothetical protein